MPTPNQQKFVSSAIDAIRHAENLLTDQIQSSTVTLTAIKLTHEYNNLDSFLSELLHVQNAVDDVSFTSATQALQSRVGGLKADEAVIKTIIKDVSTVGKIIGYVTQALELIAKL